MNLKWNEEELARDIIFNDAAISEFPIFQLKDFLHVHAGSYN